MSYSRIALFLAGLLLAWQLFSGSQNIRVLEPNGGYSYPGYEIAALERFELEGTVVSRKDYSSDREAELSPTDLGMAWGEMRDEENLSAVRFSQRNRWMFWKTDRWPIPRRRFESQVGNIHIIPANEEVLDTLARVKSGDGVRLNGSLVEARATDGWRWRSSLSRTDTGDGSCELLFLERISWM